MGFAERITISEKKRIYRICERAESGEKVWFVVHVAKNKIVAFKSIPKGKSYQVADYGTILKWGYGDSVPTHVHDEIENI